MGKTNKQEIEKTIIEGFCDRFTSTYHTPIRSLDMVRILGLLSDKYEYRKILNGTWTLITYLYEDTKDILLRMGKIQMFKAFVYIKVDITRDLYRYHWRRAR